ncbi:MAG: LysE family translocator [Candidatus Thiodiazotropha sp. (ex Lucinoma borealis)]|nr:LysE family translocator [Candidatus Thiodiazotropha sp. (ex Lucinoma borealis)]
MFVTEFLITSFIVVLMPGTGVIYTVSMGLTKGGKASLYAAFGCTAGIVPHLAASVFGLAAILHASALAFQVFKFFGVLYLAYLAWSMWKESGAIDFDQKPNEDGYEKIALRAFFINILNPKLSIFFLAFLPQFVPVGANSPITYMLGLSGVFMLMTLIVFIGYGLLANQFRYFALESPKVVQGIQRVFAGLFVALGIKLAGIER